jgi:hypothetical protein
MPERNIKSGANKQVKNTSTAKNREENIIELENNNEKSNIGLIKEYFPKYKVNDASNRNIRNMITIESICHSTKDVLVYLKRNKINEEYFSYIEKAQADAGIKTDKIDVIFLNGENFYYYSEENTKNFLGPILHLKQTLGGTFECTICNKKCIEQHFACDKCAVAYCTACLMKSTDKKCKKCSCDAYTLFDTSNK